MYPHDFEDTINVKDERRQTKNRVPRRTRLDMTPGFTVFLCVALVALCAVVALSMPH